MRFGRDLVRECRQGAGRVHAPCPQPCAEPSHRRQFHRVRAGRRPAELLPISTAAAAPGSSGDLIDLIKLHHSLNVPHRRAARTWSPWTCRPKAALDFAYPLSTLSDRVWWREGHRPRPHRGRPEDAGDRPRHRCRGTGAAARPLHRHQRQLAAARRRGAARRADRDGRGDQAAIITPFTLAGAMARSRSPARWRSRRRKRWP